MSVGDTADQSGPISGWRLILAGAIAAAGLALLPGCAVRPAATGIEQLYSRQQHPEGPERQPVVVIPGIPASRLVETIGGRVAWDPIAGIRSGRGQGPPLPALPMRPGSPLRELHDGLRPAGIPLPSASRSAGTPRAIGAYADIVAALTLGGYRSSIFRFEYDWRRDLVESAAQLHRFLLDRRAEIRAVREGDGTGRAAPIRFDIVAHATGGLLLRYYLRYGDADLPGDGSLPPLLWTGAELVERAILIGTPNAGGIGALTDLVGGEGAAVMPPFAPTVLGTYPSAYQMLPRGRHGRVVRIQGDARRTLDDLFDPALWENLGWGLASPDHDDALARLLPLEPDPVARRRIALDHLRKCLRRARRFCAALDVPGHPPAGLSLHLMATDTSATDAVAGIDWATGRVRVIEQRPGDGLVLRSSALLDERVGGRWSPSLLSPIDWSSVTFFHTDGADLGADPAFIDNLLFLLLEQPRRRTETTGGWNG